MRSERLETRLRASLRDLTDAERRIGEYLAEDASLVGFSTAATASRKMGVSEATLIRFARTLGYESFTDFQRDIKLEIQEILNEPTTTRLVHASNQPHDTPFTTLNRTIEVDTKNLKVTLERVSPEAFNRVIEWLAAAPRVLVIGLRASGGAATYLAYLLNFLRPGVTTISEGAELAFDRLLDTCEDDLAFIITLSRPTFWITEIARHLKQQRVRIVLLTDALLSPLAEFADEMFIAESESTGYVQSYTATISLCSSIASALALSDESTSTKRLALIESVLRERPVWSRNATIHTNREDGS